MHSQLLTAIAAPPGNEDESGAGLLAEKREIFQKNINLDLGIGSSAYASEGELKKNKKIKQEKKESLFTAAQFHEFFIQILVYNYIISGLPVAFHLLLPIWMSVYNSFALAIYKKYPSFTGFSPHNSDHSSVMDDPEPGRCRRTDGRKWRCSKNVVPHQKYCERHMHRGRQGSRKHVEPIENFTRSDLRNSDDNRMSVMSLVSSDIDNKIAISVQSDLDPSQPCSNCRSGVPAILKCRSDGNRDALFANQSSIDAFTVVNGVKKNINADYATSTCSNSKTDYTTNEGKHAEGKSSFDGNPRKISNRKQSAARNNYVGFISPGFGLSPKSVLHCAAGKVCVGLGSKTVAETEPQRCRRTDGKKWQCRREALCNQKYCDAHMHRGAKKHIVNPEPVSCFRATSARRVDTSIITRNLDNGINLNTLPTSPQHITSNNSTSSTSDATTITDENISFCLTQSLRNC